MLGRADVICLGKALRPKTTLMERERPMKTLELENIGAVKSLSLPIPEEGGLVVLKGTQGCGKSTTLKAVDSLLRGEGTLEKRDGSLEGSVDGFGVTITVKKSTRRTGELEVESLDGKLSIAELVDPGITDPDAADAKRIKALVQLAGVEADPSLFYDLVGGQAEFLRIVGETKETDLLKLAGLVKRKMEAAAREVESSADKAAGSARTYRESAAKVGDAQPIDPAKLQSDLEAAIGEEAALKQAAKTAGEVQAAAAEARAALAKAEAEYDGLTAEGARDKHARLSAESASARATVAGLKSQLEAAEERLRDSEQQERSAKNELDKAESHVKDMLAWRLQIDKSASVAAVDESALSAAKQKISDLRQEIERQALVRKAVEDRASAQQADLEYQKHAQRATALRESIGKIDGVLSDLVGKLNCPLRVKNGRLVLDTDRGEEYFADLSQGERILQSVPIAAQKLPRDGVLTIPQQFYGEIAPANRRLLHETLRQHGVVGITALATDDEQITAGVFGT